MVEWKEMWQVTTWDKKFSGVDKAMQPKVIKYHYYLANELSELERQNGDIRILYTTDKIAFADSADVDGNISEGEVVAIPWGGNVTIKYYKGKFVTADNRIATSNNTNYLNNKFLYYWMLSQTDLISSFYRGAGIQHPSMYKVLTMPVPIPSLSEQTRIVGILDTFAASIDNLKEQIAQRRKQYEYYSDQLLDLEGKPGVEWFELLELCDYVDYRGKTPSKVDAGIFLVTAKNIRKGYIDYDNSKEYISEDDFEEVMHRGKPQIGDVLVTTEAPLGNVAQIDNENIALAQRVIKYRPKDERLNSSYLKYILLGSEFQIRLEKEATGATAKGIKGSKLHRMHIPLPPLSEQQRIVTILDTFEASIRNLEAQQMQREKQYEYYRNKLLTFER